jgi:hypothetical protein
VIELLPSKLGALDSIPSNSTQEIRKKERKGREGGNKGMKGGRERRKE